MVKAHIVNHTHWDREWYFTTSDALVLSEQLFTEVLDVLENSSEANFTLDGQISIVDEYLAIHPENTDRIKKLVEQKKLFIGPWFTQSDGFLPDTESILRNLMIGIHDSRRLGEPMRVGYLPDTFGFNAQMPTILQQAGIDNMIFWRGVNYDKNAPAPYFKWQGLGTQKIIAINMPFGYGTAAMIEDTESYVTERLDPAIQFMVDKGAGEDVMIPSGGDQLNIVANIKDVLAGINQKSGFESVIGSYPEFLEVMRNKVDNLRDYQGDLRDPVYARVHRSIGSVRSRIKIENFQLEQKILKRVEPMIVIGNKVGIHIGNGLLMLLWKKVLECQAHDSLGGCVSDNVATDIFHRFKEANEIADSIENTITKKMADSLKLSDNEIIVYNTNPYDFLGYKELDAVVPNTNIQFDQVENPVIIEDRFYPERDNVLKETPEGPVYYSEPSYHEIKVRGKISLPALGYKIITFETSEKALDSSGVEKVLNKVSISNDNQTLEFANGNLLLKFGDTKTTSILELVDSANAGDTYDYSPLEGDYERNIGFNSAHTMKNSQFETMILDATTSLPQSINERLSSEPQMVNYPISMELTLFKEEPGITIKIKVDNTVLDHRLRLKIHTENKDGLSLAGVQNGFISRRLTPVQSDWDKKFVEKPENIGVFDKHVTVTGTQATYTVVSKGSKEYELKDGDLFITLLATVGELGRPDLAWRPGRASGDTTKQGHIMMATPLAQELGENQFGLSLLVTKERQSEQQIIDFTDTILDQSISYQKQSLNFFIHRLDNKIQEANNLNDIPREMSGLKLAQKYTINAVYPAYYDQKAYVVRLSNQTSKAVEIKTDLFDFEYEFVNALEEKIDSPKQIEPYDMLSLKIPY